MLRFLLGGLLVDDGGVGSFGSMNVLSVLNHSFLGIETSTVQLVSVVMLVLVSLVDLLAAEHLTSVVVFLLLLGVLFSVNSKGFNLMINQVV